MRRMIFILFYPNEQREGGVRCQTFCFVFFPVQHTTSNSTLVRWTLDFGMDSRQVFGGFGSKDFRLRCFVVKLI